MFAIFNICRILYYWVTPRLDEGYPSNLISLCVLRALRGDISLLLKQIRDCGWLHWPAKPSAPVTCDRFLPMKCSTERFNKDFLAKTPRPQRKIFSYFSELGVLCAVEYRLTKIELFARSAIPRGESSFIRFPKPKFSGKFQISLDSICLPRTTRRSRRIYNQIISAPEVQTPWSI